MIRIFKLVLLLVVSQVAFGQAPTNYTNINGRYRWIAGMFDSTFHIPKGTSASLRTGGSTNAGALFYNTTDSSVYTYTGTQWIKLRGVIIDTTSLSNRINLKLNISDTASMLSPYARTNAVNAGLALKVNISDTSSMLSPYLRKVDTTAMLSPYKTFYPRTAISLTTTGTSGAATYNNSTGVLNIPQYADQFTGTVTSVATNNGTGITGGTITTAGTLAIDTALISTRLWRQKGIDSVQGNLTAGLALKVNISDTASMLSPYLRKVDTTNKFVSQVYKKNGSDSVFYVRGGNHLWAFNDSTGNPGGGGGGKIYYFNGGVSMGTFGGFTMYELGDTANTGAAANFTRATTGNIANFITDPGKPGLLQIPAGVWTIDAYLSETGSGSNNAEIYAQVEKWDGSTITTIATSPIEQITNGPVIDLYTWSVSIPTTSLAVTDRIIIQFYIQNTNGKTVTLYTQNGYVGEVHTTFTTGIGAINGLTAPAQYLVTGTSGTDFNISSVTATHTFNLPTASATNRGALSSADWTAFNNKGSVSSVATNNATGITGGTITTTGTLAIDTTVISTRLWRQKGVDSVQSNLTAGLALKVNISDTASMLLPYLRKIDTASLSNRINLKVNISDTTSMLSPYLRAIDTASLSNRINLKVNISDTASMLSPYLRKVDTASLSNRINTKLNISDTTTMLGNYVNNVGYGLTKVSQVVSADSATLSAYYLRRKDSLTSTNLLGYVTRTVLADSAAAIRAAAGAGTVTGSGTATEVAFWNGSSSLSSSSNLYWDNSNSRLGINNSTPTYPLTVNGSVISTAENAYYWTKPSSPSSDIYSLSANSSGAYIYNHTTTNTLAFFAEGGNVGIGTVTPDSMLTVTNGARFERGVRMSGLSTGVGTKAVRIDANGTLSVADTTTGGISGSGTTNYIPKFTSSSAIGNSQLFDDGTNVGIGTAIPAYKLDVSGDVRFTGNLRVEGNTDPNSAAAAFFWNQPFLGPTISGYNFEVRTGNTGSQARRLFINETGAATFLSSVTAGGYTSVIAKSGTGVQSINLLTLQTTGTGAIGDSLNIRFINPQSYNIANISAILGGDNVAYGSLAFSTRNYFTDNMVEVMRINNRGNVGIGTTTIGSKLQVNGNAAIGYSASTAAPTNGLAVAGNVGINTTTIGSRLQVNGNAAIGYSASTAAASNGLAVAGNVGVGIAAPTFQMHLRTSQVTGFTGFSSYDKLVIENGNSGEGVNIQLVSNATNGVSEIGFSDATRNQGLLSYNHASDIMNFGVNGSTRFSINSSGILFAGNGETAASPSTGIISGTGGSGTNIAGAEFRIRGGASTGNAAGGPITFYTSAAGSSGSGVNAATERMRINSVGEVRTFMSTTNTTQYFSSARITIQQTSATNNNFANLSFLGANADDAAAIWTQISSHTAGATTGNLVFGTTNAGSAATERMRITNTGTVGINTATIGSTLQVNGNVAIGYSASTAGPSNGLAVSGDVSIGTNTANSKLHVAGSLRLPITTKTATYTLDATDYTVRFDCVTAAANLTANLPDATTCTGRIYTIISNSSATYQLTVDGNGGQTIGGDATIILDPCYNGATLVIQSDGSNWQIISFTAWGGNRC